jgi:hypothetical protein
MVQNIERSVRLRQIKLTKTLCVVQRGAENSMTRRGLDEFLIYQARKFINGANVHEVETWIFCYEFSRPQSEGRERYEKILRKFVASNKLFYAQNKYN